MNGCVFCDIVAGRAPGHFVWKDERCVAILDIFPVSEGHVLVLPREHVALVGELEPGLRAHLLEVACRVIRAQRAAGIGARAANLLLNDGAAANQHFPHVHLHVIPRSGGDLARLLLRLASRFVGRPSKKKDRELEAIALRLAEAAASYGAIPSTTQAW